MTRPLTALALCVAATSFAAPPEKKPLTMGIAQQYGEEHAAKAKAMLEPYLTKQLGSQVTVQVFPTYEALSDALGDGSVDLAWATPLAFVKASQKNVDVQAAMKAMRAGDGGLFYRSVFIVKKDSAIKALADLKGKNVAWVGKLSASGYLFPRELLRNEKLNPDSLFGSETFAGDHPAVCKAVREGKADVGATFASEPKEGAQLKADGCSDAPPVDDFRVIASSSKLPNEVIALSARFPPFRTNDVLATFGRMGKDDAGKKLLKEAFRVEGWGVAVEGDFAPVIELLQAKTKAKVATETPAADPKGSKTPAPKAPKKK